MYGFCWFASCCWWNNKWQKKQALYILGGLNLTYTSAITNITNKKRVIGLDELFTSMKTLERKIQMMSIPDSQLVQANYTRISPSGYTHQQHHNVW